MTKITILKLMRQLGHIPRLPWDAHTVEGMSIIHCENCHDHVVLWDKAAHAFDAHLHSERTLAAGRPLSKKCEVRGDPSG